MQPTLDAFTAIPPRHDAIPAAVKAGLPGLDARGLDALGTVMVVERDEEIYTDGDLSDHWFKLVKGCVRTVKIMSDGRRQIGEFVLANEFFGFDSAEQRYFSAEVIADATLVRFPRMRMEAMADRDPQFARRLRDLTSRGLGAAHRRLVLLGRKSAPERLASFMLEMHGRLGSRSSRILDLPMARSDIADYLGLTIETVSRVLSQFKRDRLIALPSIHRVEILDLDALVTLGGEA